MFIIGEAKPPCNTPTPSLPTSPLTPPFMRECLRGEDAYHNNGLMGRLTETFPWGGGEGGGGRRVYALSSRIFLIQYNLQTESTARKGTALGIFLYTFKLYFLGCHSWSGCNGILVCLAVVSKVYIWLRIKTHIVHSIASAPLWQSQLLCLGLSTSTVKKVQPNNLSYHCILCRYSDFIIITP